MIDRLSIEEIDQILSDLKSEKKSILECIMYLHENLKYPLLECSDAVLNSKVWIAEKQQWIKNHEQSEIEFFDSHKANDKTPKNIVLITN